MADAVVKTSTPDPVAGNPIDVTTVATGAGSVDRQRVSIGDATAANNAAVSASGALKVDNSAVTQPVSAAALPLPAGASTDATLALIKAKTDNLDVLLSTRTKPADTQKIDGSAVTQPVSAASLPLPAGAATETTLGTRLADSTFTGRINTQGQKAMAASTPVVLASDQSALPVSAASLPLPAGAATEATLALIKTDADKLPADPAREGGNLATLATNLPAQGQAQMIASVPVTLASDQTSLYDRYNRRMAELPRIVFWRSAERDSTDRRASVERGRR